jgi:hypothetical protein
MKGPLVNEWLKLNPNCCYQSCGGCTSIARLRDFRGRHPGDWKHRLVGLPRLLEAARQHEGIGAAGTAPQNGTCEECGAFDAYDFGHIRLCGSCHAVKGACCANSDEN